MAPGRVIQITVLPLTSQAVLQQRKNAFRRMSDKSRFREGAAHVQPNMGHLRGSLGRLECSRSGICRSILSSASAAAIAAWTCPVSSSR